MTEIAEDNVVVLVAENHLAELATGWCQVVKGIRPCCLTLNWIRTWHANIIWTGFYLLKCMTGRCLRNRTF